MGHPTSGPYLFPNGPVALYGQEEVSSSGGVMGSAKDFMLVLLQEIDPRAHIRGVLLGVVRNSSFRG
jgi:hypothetical protein